MNFCGTLCALLEYFCKEKTPPASRELICNETLLQNLSLSNIMKHGESDVERQINIQGIHLSAFWNCFWKEKEALKLNTVLMKIY